LKDDALKQKQDMFDQLMTFMMESKEAAEFYVTCVMSVVTSMIERGKDFPVKTGVMALLFKNPTEEELNSSKTG